MNLDAQQRAFAIGANGLRHHAAFTLDAYAENVHALAGALAAAGCRVALVTLPPIGEDLDSAVNVRVKRVGVPAQDTVDLPEVLVRLHALFMHTQARLLYIEEKPTWCLSRISFTRVIAVTMHACRG